RGADYLHERQALRRQRRHSNRRKTKINKKSGWRFSNYGVAGQEWSASWVQKKNKLFPQSGRSLHDRDLGWDEPHSVRKVRPSKSAGLRHGTAIHHQPIPHAAHLIPSWFPARGHDTAEAIKTLPCRLDRRDTRMRDINRG